MNKPDCHNCAHSRTIPGDCHLECTHPRIGEADKIITPLLLLNSLPCPAMKRLNVQGDHSGIRNGWFMWPLNFDPTWLLTCDGFEKKGGEEREQNEVQ